MSSSQPIFSIFAFSSAVNSRSSVFRSQSSGTSLVKSVTSSTPLK